MRRIIRDYWNRNHCIPDDDIAIPNTVADFIGDYDIDVNYLNSFSYIISSLPWRGIGIITAIILAIAYIINP